MPVLRGRSASVERFQEAALLGMMASGFFAMAASLDLVTAGITVAALAIRGAMLLGILSFEFPPKLGFGLGLAAAGFYLADTLYISKTFVGATVHVVCILAAIKILSARTRRDFGWVRVIALLEMLAASLVSTNPLFLAFFCAFVICTISAFASGEIVKSLQMLPEQGVARTSLPFLNSRLTLVSGFLFVSAMVITVVLFFVLPRTVRAAARRFAPSGYHVSGFAKEISLGEIGELKKNNAPVLRVRSFDGEPLDGFHWRGSALAQFDGSRWFNPPGAEELIRSERGYVALDSHRARGKDLQYEVELSSAASETLLFAGNPKTISVNTPYLIRDRVGSIRIPSNMPGLHYGVFAILENSVADIQAEGDESTHRMTNLPAVDARVFDLARSITIGESDSFGRAKAIERYLQTRYQYTTDLPVERPRDPIADFLFSRRQGHCEYFASSMAVMLRTVGIPSRVAVGFLSGARNRFTGWQVIRASDAHSWVEAWIEERGWVTFDPTPPDPNFSESSLVGLSLFADTIGQVWEEWVVDYNFQRQVSLVARIEQGRRGSPSLWLTRGWDWKKLGANGPVSIGAGMVVVATLLTFFIFRRSIRTFAQRWLRRGRIQAGSLRVEDSTDIYLSILNVLESRGYSKPAWITANEFARMLPDSEITPLVENATNAYYGLRFGRRSDSAGELVELLSRIKGVATAER